MCLYTLHKEPKIADKDITCYKVLEIWNPEWDIESGRKRKSKKTVLRSYYHPDFKWNVDKRYRSKLEIEPNILNSYDIFRYLVTEGFHSYQTLDSAKEFCKSTAMEPCVIVRCIIPKGAKYCEGMHSDKQDGYSSNQIIMKEIVDFKELYPDFDSDKYPYKQGQLLMVSTSDDFDGIVIRVCNIVPLNSNIIRLKGCLEYYDTDTNGIPVLGTVKIKVYNDKKQK